LCVKGKDASQERRITDPSLSDDEEIRRERLPNSAYCVDRRGTGNDFNPDRGQSLPLKSLSPDQPPRWNDPYRMLES